MTKTTEVRRAPPLIPGMAVPAPGLTLSVAVISLLASLDLTGASVLARTLPQWSERLAGSATVAAAGRDLESADAAAARAAEILGRAPGVLSARVLDPSPMDALAARALGLTAGGPSGAPPRLIAVTVRGGGGPTADQAAGLLRHDGLAVAVDDHGPWSGPLERLGAVLAGAMALLLISLVAILATVAGGSARRAIRGRRDRLSLLVQLGAASATLSRQFRGRAIASTTLGATLGTGAAVLAAGALAFDPPAAIWLSARLPAMPQPMALDVLFGALWLPLAIGIAAWAAHRAARTALRSLS